MPQKKDSTFISNYLEIFSLHQNKVSIGQSVLSTVWDGFLRCLHVQVYVKETEHFWALPMKQRKCSCSALRKQGKKSPGPASLSFAGNN